MSKAMNQYRLEIVSNYKGEVHLRLKPPRGNEIIMYGEKLYDARGARRVAGNMEKGLLRGIKVVEILDAVDKGKQPSKFDADAENAAYKRKAIQDDIEVIIKPSLGRKDGP